MGLFTSHPKLKFPKSFTLKDEWQTVKITYFHAEFIEESGALAYEICGTVFEDNVWRGIHLDCLSLVADCYDKFGRKIDSFDIFESACPGVPFRYIDDTYVDRETVELRIHLPNDNSNDTRNEESRQTSSYKAPSVPKTTPIIKDKYTLTIHREDQFFVINPDFQVYINGVHKGSISNGSTGTIDLKPGTYEIKFKGNAFLSTTVRVTMNQDKTINLSINRITGRMVARVYNN